MATDLLPVHPGEVLLEEFLEPLGLSQDRVTHRNNRRLAVGPAQQHLTQMLRSSATCISAGQHAAESWLLRSQIL